MALMDNKITFLDMSGLYSNDCSSSILAKLREQCRQHGRIQLCSDQSGVVKTTIRSELVEKDDLICVDLCNVRGTECYCDDEAQSIIKDAIISNGVSAESLHYIDNGNYHYLSKIFLDFIKEPFNLLVFDNHPDMQPPAFGDILSCGSWVKDVIDTNPYINNVFLCGVNPSLVTEEMLSMDKVHFCEFSTQNSAATVTGRGKTGDDDVSDTAVTDRGKAGYDDVRDTAVTGSGKTGEDDVGATVVTGSEKTGTEALSVIELSDLPLYISIDKDVLDERDYTTNWDQGTMRIEQLESLLTAVISSSNICGIDICGGASPHDEAAQQQNADADFSVFKTIMQACELYEL